MRIIRLADLFEHKYNDLIVKNASPAEILSRVKDEILTNYKNWVMGKYRALKILAEAGEPHAKFLYTTYNDLVSNIDTYTAVQIFNRINKILSMITEMKVNKKYRDSIHDMVSASKESDRNYREQLKSGFETNISRISYGLDKIQKVLRAFIPDTEIAGGIADPQRKDLSKEKLLMFMKTPAAQYYGLDNIEVVTQALSYPEVKNKIITLINSIDRGHLPADGPEVMSEVRAIKSWLDAKQTNLPALEQIPEKPASNSSLFEEKEELK